MLSHLRPALVTIALMTLLTGVAYPLAVTGFAQAMRGPAEGSLVRDANGHVIGSALIGQAFAKPEYLHGRPSAAGNGYDPTASGGSNYGPLDPKLADRVKGDAATLAQGKPRGRAARRRRHRLGFGPRPRDLAAIRTVAGATYRRCPSRARICRPRSHCRPNTRSNLGDPGRNPA